MKSSHSIALGCLVVLVTACGREQPPLTPLAAIQDNAVDESVPACVTDLIAELEAAPVASPPLSVTRYTYDQQTVYFVPDQCCDFFSTLYDSSCNVICAPSGGIAGGGDGGCPDFFNARTGGELIWQDPRGS